MASSVDLSGFFEKEQDISERTIRFTSNHSPKKLIEGIGFIVTQMGFLFRKRSGQKRKTFDENFLRKDTSSLYKLVNAAHYLQLRPLYKKTYSAIARKIEDESPEEICCLFNFPDLFLLEKIRPNIYISAIFQPHFHNRLVKFLISWNF
nr:PREDICTED: CBL-interacting serine/threonine-protein kinase 1-like [Daucus carota subsp. sativus]